MIQNIVIYHANCSDGLGAAYAAWEKMGSSAVYLPCSYGTDWREFIFDHPKLESVDGEDVRHFSETDAKNTCLFIVDFSFPKQDILDMCEYFGSVTVLDHHDTARQDLEEIVGSRNNLLIIFDMERSGAGIAWDYFHGVETRPHMISLIEDRDLWRFKYGDESKAFQMYMKQEKPNIPDLRETARNIETILESYMSVLEYHNAMVKEVAEHALIKSVEITDGITSLTVIVAFVNGPYHMASDLGEVLGEYSDIVCTWGHNKNNPGRIWLSLRSQNKTHVGELAKKYFNGGGHPAAAGGWLSIHDFFHFMSTGLLPQN